MSVRQTRIFVPAGEPETDWAETLVGRVLRPLTAEFAEPLDWFWFSRYGAPADDSGDCDIAKIPVRYKQPLEAGADDRHRSLRFRFAIADDRLAAFEQRARQLIAAHDYCISDFRPYDCVGDTGSHRFLGVENRQPNRAAQRARLVTQFYLATCRLLIDALVGPDEGGRYRLETNDDAYANPRGSSFQSIHHLFCNITSVPTDVYVFQKTGLNVIGFGTSVYPPTAPPGGWDGSTAHPIWY